MKILLAPHNDDETLFAAFTLIREKPLVIVVTDSFVQAERGDPITWQQRRQESKEACELLGCEVKFLGIRDTDLHSWPLSLALLKYHPDTVYVPAVQGGHAHHDLVGRVGKSMFPDAIQYTTYTKTELHTTGSIEIVPTPEELALKKRALACYRSQLELPSTRPHFQAVEGKSEWYV